MSRTLNESESTHQLAAHLFTVFPIIRSIPPKSTSKVFTELEHPVDRRWEDATQGRDITPLVLGILRSRMGISLPTFTTTLTLEIQGDFKVITSPHSVTNRSTSFHRHTSNRPRWTFMGRPQITRLQTLPITEAILLWITWIF